MKNEKIDELEKLAKKYIDYANKNGINIKKIHYAINDEDFGIGILIENEMYCFNEKDELIKQ